MKEISSILLILLLATMLTASGCAQPPAQTHPSSDSAGSSTADSAGSSTATATATASTSESVASTAEVSSAQGGSVDLSKLTPEPFTPTPSDSTSGAANPPGTMKTVSLDDQGGMINLLLGESFLLNLGERYTWDISISSQPDGVISRVKNITVIRGAQGVYETLKAGTAILTASGDPLCRQSNPPCGQPSIQIQITFTIR